MPQSVSRLLLRRSTLIIALLIISGVTLVPRYKVTTAATSLGPRQSSPVALSGDDHTLVNVNPEANTITVFDVTSDTPIKLGEVAVGRDPNSVAIHPDGTKAYVANSFDGTISIVSLNSLTVSGSFAVGLEPMAVALSPNGTRLYVANSASNTLSVVNTVSNAIVATVDLSAFGTAPRAIAVTNNGDASDADETVFVALFYGQLRPGKTFLEEGQDDQREGRVVAISAATNTPLGSPNPVTLGPIANTGFNSNGQLAPANGLTPAVASTNPQTFTTPTGAFPNQLASIALHPSQARAYVVSTGASPNGPLRFNQMAQGLVSLYDTGTRMEITAAQTDPNVRRTAPLNLNQGINLGTTPAPRLFMTNPVAMTWRPNGSDAWIAVQHTDLVVRATIDANGIPTVNNPLVAGPSTVVRVDLEDPSGGQIPGKAPQGLVINSTGTRLYSYNFVSRSITVMNISNPTSPSIAGTGQASPLPNAGTPEGTAHLGEELFFSGRGLLQGRMSSEGWGSCVVCHPRGRSDNVTWMFDAGPRQTIPLDGTFNKLPPHDQRILNWSGIRDENHDFELNTRGVFGGRGLIDDDRLSLAIGGASGATPTDSALIEQFNNFTGVRGTTNDLAGGAPLPALLDARRDFAIATLGDDRVFIIGGRSGADPGTLITGANTVLEFNPRTNVLTPRSSTGFTTRHSLGAGAVRTSQGIRIYAVGGYNSTSGAASPVSTVEEYNPATDTWRTVASLPTAVAQFGITVAGGVNTAEPLQLIHVVSGNTGSESVPSVANPNPVQRFLADPVGPGTWSAFSVPGLTLRRNHGVATAIRGVTSRVFVIGGQDAGGTVLDTVEELLAQAVVVVATPHTSLPAPRARFGIGSTLTTNQIYVIGGIDGMGTDQTTLFEYTINNQGPTAGPPGTPSGAWLTRANLSVARRGLQASTTPGVTNFLPFANTGRDSNQDAIAAFVATIRSARAPVPPSDPGAMAGKTLFNTVGLVQPGFSCATCHGGPKFTRSTVDYTPPPSPEIGLGFGNERVIGAELRQTATQNPAFPNAGLFPGVLINVGTFTPNSAGGRVNEIRANAADPGQAIAPLGANGFNIPSLFSVHETAPYFYSGLAQTLNEVLDGSQDGNGGTQHHFVVNATQRAQLIAFLRSIDAVCTITCPGNITQSNDTNQCGAVVTYPAPTSTGTCATITCIPASGSLFPVGTTTVTCTSSAAAAAGSLASGAEAPAVCTPQTITQSSSQAITSLNSVSCNNGIGHTDNSYYRAFTLSSFGITNQYDIASVDIGVELADAGGTAPTTGKPSISANAKGKDFAPGATTQPITINLYTSSMPFPTGFPGSLTQIGTTNTTVADQSGAVVNIPVTGSAPAGSQLVVEVFTPDGTAAGNLFFIGSNAAPETGSSYLRAAACGVTTPTTTAALGFPNMHIVMNVNGCQQSGPTCSFTVTVNDTQPPTITCPANITAVTDQNACPGPACQVVTFPAPVASDNCPGVTVVCNPPSGGCLPVGVTTVTCTATDASGNTATCSFTISTFDVALQDDSDPSIILLWNSLTGAYRFCCNGITFTGVGTSTVKGCVFTLQHNPADRRVLGRVDKAVHAGTASIQAPPGTIRCTITDRNTLNDTLLPACQ